MVVGGGAVGGRDMSVVELNALLLGGGGSMHASLRSSMSLWCRARLLVGREQQLVLVQAAVQLAAVAVQPVLVLLLVVCGVHAGRVCHVVEAEVGCFFFFFFVAFTAVVVEELVGGVVAGLLGGGCGGGGGGGVVVHMAAVVCVAG